MSYDAFLLVMSQLAGKRKARVVIHSRVIFFETSQKKNHCTLYTKVYSKEGHLPKSVRSCFVSSQMLRFQSRGTYLKLDLSEGCVYLFREIEMPIGKYIPFRDHLKDFSLAASEWEETFQDVAPRESAIVN